MGDLLSCLAGQGYTLVGPRVREGAICYDRIRGIEDLPRGFRDEQAPGSYRLSRGNDAELFGFASSAQSFKRWFHPPAQRLFSVRRGADGPELRAPPIERTKLALIGARGCDLAALRTLDAVFIGGAGPEDIRYATRRHDIFVVAVNCGVPASTCFCTSMGTGPVAEAGYDIALTELVDDDTTAFVATVGSDAGTALLERVGTVSADDESLQRQTEVHEQAKASIVRHLDTDGIKDLIANNSEHPAWDEVAERCLACANCTMVCPTCFCSTVEDAQGLDEESHRDQRWDSCFTLDFSHLHGGPVRGSVKARYRQWLSHKFSTWFEQFGSSGCVGCGRCVTWCPVGIDVRAQVDALRPKADCAAGTTEDI